MIRFAPAVAALADAGLCAGDCATTAPARRRRCRRSRSPPHRAPPGAAGRRRCCARPPAAAGWPPRRTRRSGADATAVDPLRPDVRSISTTAPPGRPLAARAPPASRSRPRRRAGAQPRALVRRAARLRAAQRMTDRGSRYLFHIVEEVEKRRLPTELALLPFIESAFNPGAVVAKASGIWQFMPATGRTFELRQNVFRDDRRDVLASTRRASTTSKRLHGMFGDWHLALAAYNWGGQRAARHREEPPRRHGHQLREPAHAGETRWYVPKLQAVKNIVARPAEFGLTLPPLANHPYFVAVGIERDIDVALAARLAQLPLDEFRALNPQMNKPVILAPVRRRCCCPTTTPTSSCAPCRRTVAPSPVGRPGSPQTLKPSEAAKLVGMGRRSARGEPHPAAHAGEGRLDAAGAAQPAARTRSPSTTLAENATMALAPDGPSLRRVSPEGRQARQRRQRYWALSRQCRPGGTVERTSAPARTSAPGRPSSSPWRTNRHAAAAKATKARKTSHAPRRRQEDHAAPKARAGERRERRSLSAGRSRMGDGAEVDVFELAADRHAACHRVTFRATGRAPSPITCAVASPSAVKLVATITSSVMPSPARCTVRRRRCRARPARRAG